ncbi:MAG: YihY/virulence factor BrkB family protein [Phycisphaerae bacterium]|nr:YihY/virulence factor BrkB family protein [Phycisphaerae bacterium]
MSRSAAGRVQQYIERVRSAPGDELGRWARFLRFQMTLWRFCARRLWQNNVGAMSAALSFRTLFAMIPVLVLAMLILKSMGVLEDSRQSMRRLFESTGIAQINIIEQADPDAPAGQKPKTLNVADEIERLAANVESKLSVRRIGPVGAVLLIWTALTLITTVERSLNRIFEAPRSRPLGRRLLLYWALLTLVPVVSVTAMYAGRQVTLILERQSVLAWLLAVAGWTGPILAGILVVAAVYSLLPTTHVPYRAALAGAVIAVPFWLIAKWGFGLYVTRFVRTGNLYGALGLLPLFLIWLNLSWWIFLFGAQLAHTASNLGVMRTMEERRRRPIRPADLLAAAVAVAGPYENGRGPVDVEAAAAALGLSKERTQRLLDRLVARDVLCRVKSKGRADAYSPVRPADRTTLTQVLGLDARGNNEPAVPLDAAAALAWNQARNALGQVTLADAVPRPETPKPDSAT